MPASSSTSSVAGIVDPLVENELATTDAPSLTIEIARAGTPIYIQAYGQQNLASRLAAAATTPYQIGSVTKQFTAAAVLTLVESSEVDLDTPVVAYRSNGATTSLWRHHGRAESHRCKHCGSAAPF